MGKLITTKQAAEILGLSHRTLAGWRQKDKSPLPYYRFDERMVRYDEDDVRALMDANRVKPTTG